MMVLSQIAVHLPEGYIPDYKLLWVLKVATLEGGLR